MSSSKKESSPEESSWVYDSLVGFLAGPVWQVPILTFIENKSLIFEPDHDAENDQEYRRTYDDYKKLVDFMLNSFREDLNIEPGQFTEACRSSKKHNVSQFRQCLFEQVYAAEDFTVFTRMMIQKNIELQLQALELLRAKYGVLPVSLQPKTAAAAVAPKDKTKEQPSQDSGAQDDTEAKIMEEIKRKSIEECEQNSDTSSTGKERKELGEILARSVVDQKRLEDQMQAERARLADHLYANEPEMSSPDQAAATKAGGPDTLHMSEMEIDPDELKRRTEFLKAQRDKLLEMKRAEREKHLAEVEAGQASKMRPKSAKAARSALGGAKGGRLAASVDPDTLNARRALAEKLKNEVISQSERR